MHSRPQELGRARRHLGRLLLPNLAARLLLGRLLNERNFHENSSNCGASEGRRKAQGKKKIRVRSLSCTGIKWSTVDEVRSLSRSEQSESVVEDWLGQSCTAITAFKEYLVPISTM